MKHQGFRWLVRIATAVSLTGVLALTLGQRLFVSWLLRDSGVRPQDAAAVGIIGGADGPTSILITGPSWGGGLQIVLLAVAAVGAVVLFCLRLADKRQ